MNLEIDAIYQNGLLKPDQELPLANGQRVRLTVHKPGGRAKASAGIFRWQGARKDLEYLLGADNLPEATGE